MENIFIKIFNIRNSQIFYQNKVYLQFLFLIIINTQKTYSSYLYHKMTIQQQYQIIDLVVTIFQNVGIKRCIDKIDILKNYQIYFEICKVIFPQTMIELLRFSQGILSNSQKIQGVIDIVGKILQNDLYHISGQAIAQGKLSHIRNFLHILQLLSQNVHKGNRNQQQVQSAPQNTRSLSDYDQEGHYTVIGIDKQFERQFQDQDGNYYKQKKGDEQQSTKRQHHQYQHQHQGHGHNNHNNNHSNLLNQNQNQNYNQNNHEGDEDREQTEDSQSQRPMNPVLDKKLKSSKKKLQRGKNKPSQSGQKIYIKQIKPRPLSKPLRSSSKSRKILNLALQNLLSSKVAKPAQPQRQLKTSFVKKINNIIEDMQVKRLSDLKQQHNVWVSNHQSYMVQKQNQINQQNKQRMQFTNSLLQKRKQNLNILKNAKYAINVMANLFHEQRQIWKSTKRAKQQQQIEQIESLIRGQEKDEQLLRNAIMPINPENYGNGIDRQKKRKNLKNKRYNNNKNVNNHNYNQSNKVNVMG